MRFFFCFSIFSGFSNLELEQSFSHHRRKYRERPHQEGWGMAGWSGGDMSIIARHPLSSTGYSTASRGRHDLYMVQGLSGWMVNDQHHGRQGIVLYRKHHLCSSIFSHKFFHPSPVSLHHCSYYCFIPQSLCVPPSSITTLSSSPSGVRYYPHSSLSDCSSWLFDCYC